MPKSGTREAGSPELPKEGPPAPHHCYKRRHYFQAVYMAGVVAASLGTSLSDPGKYIGRSAAISGI